MTTKLLYAAESWEKAYQAFEEINFTAYDFDSVKQSLLDHIKLKYPENFNDYIESSQLIAIVELFAYLAEQHAYRVDMATHENMLPTAARKQSVLRLARLISYSAARNTPLRGLVKLDSVSCSEAVVDSQGNNLANKPIAWNDTVNPLWREQFNLVMNRLVLRSISDPSKSFQVANVLLQQHELSNLTERDAAATSFINGTLRLKIDLDGASLPFELVPADLDESGVFERAPNPKLPFTLVYSNDGYGDSSPLTGFQLYMKQGELKKYQIVFDSPIPNRAFKVDIANINDTDVWLQEIDAADDVIAQWQEVENVNGDNLAFNTDLGTKKYEVETLENDKINILFGAGDFSDIPTGVFRTWVRASTSGTSTLPTAKLKKASVTFAYLSKQGQRESCTLTFSLHQPIQNAAQSETIEHVRAVAPGVYQAQNRMVNGEDYNNFPLQDSSIIHLKAVNRTFAGQPKYVEWNDASSTYQTIKLFGDDARMYYNIGAQATTTKVSSRSLIDEVIEPLLSTPAVYNLISYSFFTSAFPLSAAAVRPRTKLIEDASLLVNFEPLQEKTLIQGALDRHWYGEPATRVQLGPDLTSATLPKSYYGVVDNDSDKRVYDSNLKLVTSTLAGYALVPTPGAVSGIQDSVARQRKFGITFNPVRSFTSNIVINPVGTPASLGADLLTSTAVTQSHYEETITVELINEQGSFTVWGSLSGRHPNGVVGEEYDNGIVSFVLYPSTPGALPVAGDAFLLSLQRVSGQLTPLIYKSNLLGQFNLVDESVLGPNPEVTAYDISAPATSWVILVERVDDTTGQLLYWRITNRAFELTVESPTTKFWHDPTSYLVDSATGTRVRDIFKLLKSNLNKQRNRALGVDQRYFVVNRVLQPNGEVNPNALAISPDAALPDRLSSSTGDVLAPFQFLQFIGTDEYVYFKRAASTGSLVPVPTTPFIESLDYVNNETASGYVRKLGRSGLDFLWAHYVGSDNLVDPSPSNIVDMFVLSTGYWRAVQDWLSGKVDERPAPPTPYELRSTYRKILESKMISDSVVLHSAKIKPLFGPLASPELRAKLKLVKTATSKLTDEQLRIKCYELVSAYFTIDDWPMGREFYATELCSVLHAKLPADIQSAVIVPEFPIDTFGDMHYVRSAQDEVMTSCMRLEDIIVTRGLDKVILKQTI